MSYVVLCNTGSDSLSKINTESLKVQDLYLSTGENQIVLKNLCKQSLKEILTFLNPEKICSLLDNFVSCIESSLDTTYGNPNKLRIMLHTACALERTVIHDN
ncbi:hypothetical protein, partial [Clostridium saccharobutylicum]|uniref:hypothetical protein n=1 Tax=Clostridium saccharobutylicum TaxID=169679 RepID=UPI000A5537FA